MDPVFTPAIGFVLGLLLVAIILFATEKISIDIVTLGLLVLLVVVPVGTDGHGILSPREAFSGLSDEIIVILASIFVISSALQETGVLDALGTHLLRIASGSIRKLTLLLMGITSSISGFMNNTTVTALLLGPTLGVAHRTKLNPSKLLMPLAFASVLGGTCTLVGTSTNVAVSGFLKRHGFQEVTMFEVTPIGIAICITGILYMMFVGRHLLPDRSGGQLTERYELRQYLTEILVLPHSPLIGQRSFESDLSVLDFRILKVIRGKDEFLPSSRVIIEEGDILLVEGHVPNLMKVKKIEGIEIRSEFKLGDTELRGARFQVAEILLTPLSDLLGRTLKEAQVRARYGLTVLAINRHGQSLSEKIGDLVLKVGDVLLVQGPDERFAALRPADGLAVLDQVKPQFYHPKKGLFVVGMFVSAVFASAAGWIPISVAFLVAALLTVIVRCISLEKAYEFIDWRLLILIGGMTAFGLAMDKTGAATYLAHLITSVLQPWGPLAVLAGFFFLTILLTQPMSNAAAALVVVPVALEAAEILGANARTFGIGIMLAASISFITPFEPSCILVYGPGKYRFFDFVKVGGGLTVVLAIVVLALLPLLWPLN